MFRQLLVIVGLSVVALNSTTVAALGDAEEGKAKAAVCGACHGAEGISAIPANPNLAGQVPGYISAQLKAFKSKRQVYQIKIWMTLMLFTPL